MNTEAGEKIVTGVFVACAIVIAGVLVRREFFPPAARSASMQTQQKIDNWSDFQGGQPLTVGGRPISLVVFSDYECPACLTLSRRLDTLRAKFPTQLSIYYRNYPIPRHVKARPAAFAAECAARQGRFEPAYRLLFANVDSIGVRSWGRFAMLAGIADTSSFTTCVRDSLPVAVVRRDQEDGRRLNVEATPTLLLDNTLVRGAAPLAELERLVESAINAKRGSR